jgi:DNA-binding GntR family transcriptional regulator
VAGTSDSKYSRQRDSETARPGTSVAPRDSVGRTKSDLIAEELREDIAAGRIAYGTRLQQDLLARQFQTSITPVREALRHLVAEGLLDGQPHRGVSVAAPNLDQIESISVMRRLIEPYAARRAARRLNRLDFDKARAINEELRRARQPEQELHFRHLNHDFHFLIYGACGLPTLVSEIERLWAAFPWAALQVIKGRARRSADEHARMLDALIADDHPMIQTLFEEHIRNGYSALVEQLTGASPDDPFEVGEA